MIPTGNEKYDPALAYDPYPIYFYPELQNYLVTSLKIGSLKNGDNREDKLDEGDGCLGFYGDAEVSGNAWVSGNARIDE